MPRLPDRGPGDHPTPLPGHTDQSPSPSKLPSKSKVEAPGRGPRDRRLPTGAMIALSPRTSVRGGGALLVGGSAGVVLRLRGDSPRLAADGTLIVDSPRAAALARILLDRGLADFVPPAPLPLADASRVTVVIPHHGDGSRLDQLLARLDGLDVVVVDDASADRAAIEAVAGRRCARLHRLEVNRGPAAARNAGAVLVDRDFVAFLDSDVLPEPGWLDQLMAVMIDPAVGMAAPRVLGSIAAPGDGWLTRYEQARSSLDLGPMAATVTPSGAVAYVPSAALLVRRAALGTGFDEAMRCGEDVDLVWRMVGDGWQVRYQPDASVRHDHRVDLRAWMSRKAFYGTSAGPLAARHGGAVAPMRFSGWTLLATMALLAQRRWSAPATLMVLAGTIAAIAARLPGSRRQRLVVAAELVAKGSSASLRQSASSLLRHHWPLTLLACAVSPRARRATLAAVVLETTLEYRRTSPRLGLVSFAVAARLDDLAYGAGLWVGACRTGSPRALLPRFVDGRAGRLRLAGGRWISRWLRAARGPGRR